MKREECKPGVQVCWYDSSANKSFGAIVQITPEGIAYVHTVIGTYRVHHTHLIRLKPRAAKPPEGYVKPISDHRWWGNEYKVGKTYAVYNSRDEAEANGGPRKNRTAIIEWAPIARHPVGEEGK